MTALLIYITLSEIMMVYIWITKVKTGVIALKNPLMDLILTLLLAPFEVLLAVVAVFGIAIVHGFLYLKSKIYPTFK